MYQPVWQAQKGKGTKEGRKARKREKGKGAPSVSAAVFSIPPTVFPNPPPFFPSSLSPTHFDAYHAGLDVYRNQFVT